MRFARNLRKCNQCQHPWHDGTCSCGGWGAAEERIKAKAQPILDAEYQKHRDRAVKQQAEDGKGIDAGLQPVGKLEGLWEEKP